MLQQIDFTSVRRKQEEFITFILGTTNKVKPGFIIAMLQYYLKQCSF